MVGLGVVWWCGGAVGWGDVFAIFVGGREGVCSMAG